MMTLRKILAGSAGLAAFAAAAPAAAQYGYSQYGYGQYGYAQPYGYASPYGYGSPYGANMTDAAAQRCSAAVQQRLGSRMSLGGILGSMVGVPMTTSGRVLQVTEVSPRSTTVRVRGLASSGRSSGYGPYGYGAYGAMGYSYQPDLSFRCDVDYRGYVQNVTIRRR